MMLKLCTLIAATLASVAQGAPAVVWKNGRQSVEQRFVHSSESITASELLVNALPESEAPEASFSVVFLVNKSESGFEQLSELATSGKLPQTSKMYSDAACIYHHVSGIESTSTIVRDVASATNKDQVLEISLDELFNKLSIIKDPSAEVEIDNQGNTIKPSSKVATKRARDLEQANVYVVKVSAKGDVAEVDAAISSAIVHKNVNSVVLAGIRSVHEVKHERYLMSKRRMTAMEQEGNKMLDSRRRRLEQQGDDDANQQNVVNEDMSGVYYVSMTPNILSGLLFMLLFVVIAYTGISCMGAIQGQDVFTDKMPSIGREA